MSTTTSSHVDRGDHMSTTTSSHVDRGDHMSTTTSSHVDRGDGDGGGDMSTPPSRGQLITSNLQGRSRNPSNMPTPLNRQADKISNPSPSYPDLEITEDDLDKMEEEMPFPSTQDWVDLGKEWYETLPKEMLTCSKCNEIVFNTEMHNSRLNICTKCHKTTRGRFFGLGCCLDPGEVPDVLTRLTSVEASLISQIAPMVSIVFKSSEVYYTGHQICFDQHIFGLARQVVLPRFP